MHFKRILPLALLSERLGIMPILLALYLQLKDWRWGDWTVLSKITLMQGVLAFLLLLAYALSWHLIRLRVRVQAYEQLLAGANRQDSAADGSRTPPKQRGQVDLQSKANLPPLAENPTHQVISELDLFTVRSVRRANVRALAGSK